MVRLSLPVIGLLLALAAGAEEMRVAPGDLTSALAEAEPGQTLRLLAGTHLGPFEVARPLRLVGEPGAILEGSGSGNVLTITASDVSVSGLVMRGSGADLFEDDTVILVENVRRVTVENCRVEARAFGIYLGRGGEHRIRDNEIVGDRALAIARRGNGVHLWYSEHNEIERNLLVDVRDGIYLSFAHDNRIAGNQGSALRYGIHYMYSERNALIGNRFSGSTGGIALMFSMRNRIESNETHDNEQFGILCQQLEHSLIADNRAAGNGRGFYLQNSAGNRFVGNRLESNGVGAYLTAGSERNVFAGNVFAGNLVQVFDGAAGLNAYFENGRGNSWGDYSGFDWDGDGIGEQPYELHTRASALLANRPVTRWFWMSPILALLDWWDTRLPLREVTARDPYPLVGWLPSSEALEDS